MTPVQFVQLLQEIPPLPNVCNPWKDYVPEIDLMPEAPARRAAHLNAYLAARVGKAKVLLVGEAPGYQGCRFSGIAMTSERMLLGNHEVPADAMFASDIERWRTSGPMAQQPEGGAAEPTATIAWKLLLELGYSPNTFVFWNSFPFHPYKPLNRLMTNRAPTPLERVATAHVLPAMQALYPGVKVIAVGRIAQASLPAGTPAVRHPAMGGATKFREEMRAWATEMSA